MVALTGALAGCGGKDNVGVVDMSRIQKEAPLVQQYKQKTEDKQKAIDKELQDAKQTMSAEDFRKAAAGSAGTQYFRRQHAASIHVGSRKPVR